MARILPPISLVRVREGLRRHDVGSGVGEVDRRYVRSFQSTRNSGNERTNRKKDLSGAPRRKRVRRVFWSGMDAAHLRVPWVS